MFENSKIIWSAGMFLRPEHFQQQNRYCENLINRRCMGLLPYGWGFYTLKIDSDLLGIGKLGLKECQGIFQDGTPFNLPYDDELPLPMDIPEDISDEIVYLALPVRRSGSVEADTEKKPVGLARYRTSQRYVRVKSKGAESDVPLEIGKLKTRFLRQIEDQSGYTCLGVARIVEARTDKNIIIDDNFIPANLNCLAFSALRGLMNKLYGLIKPRAKEISERVVAARRGGLAENQDFMSLQLLNRYQPLLEHLSKVFALHPMEFYQLCLQLAGELATFVSPNRLPANFPPYDHEDLQRTLSPLMKKLEDWILELGSSRRAIKIELSEPRFDTYAAKRPDPSLLKNAAFVLVVNADVPTETLHRNFPRQVIIGPIGKMNEYVKSLTSGIPINLMSSAPRELPFYAGFSYFELEKRGKIWEEMADSGGFGIHIGGKFPGLKMEFWAIMGVSAP